MGSKFQVRIADFTKTKGDVIFFFESSRILNLLKSAFESDRWDILDFGMQRFEKRFVDDLSISVIHKQDLAFVSVAVNFGSDDLRAIPKVVFGVSD